MKHDRLALLQVSGFKSLSDVDVPLDGLTVLIGENGTGKSAILEAMSIFASAAQRLVHIPDVIERRFGRFERLLCSSNSSLHIQGTIRGEGHDLHYGFRIGSSGVHPVVSEEWLYQGPSPTEKDPENLLLGRRGKICEFQGADGKKQTTHIGEQALALGYMGVGASDSIDRVLRAIENLQIHPHFDARPVGQQRDLGVKDGARWPQPVEPALSLDPYGVNLASAYHQLRNTGGETWEKVLDLARLGLGEDLRDIRLPAAGRGEIELELVFGLLPRAIPAEGLSEGQICYLCFIALTQLGSSRTALAVDECELHLHPELLARVTWMLEEAAQHAPILLTTHSDRVLDALTDPAKSVCLCELDDKRRTRLRRVDPSNLSKWLENYGGIGSLRTEGLIHQVIQASVPQAESAE